MDPFHKLTKMRTLLVDNDELVRDGLRLAFMNKGCFLQATETAEEGLCALEKESFDIIISDFRLPGIDGLEFFKQATISQPNAVNILISAYGNEEVVSQASRLGVHDFIEKPFSIKTLITSLARLVKKRDVMSCKPEEEAQSEAETKTVI